MDHSDAGGFNGPNGVSQAGKVRRKNGWSYLRTRMHNPPARILAQGVTQLVLQNQSF
jgi:hypothetical protein